MLGILGGTFDPPHKAHLQIAEYLLNQFPFTKILFIPCYFPVLKQSPAANPEHRLAMLVAATKGNPKFAVDDREIKKAGPSYTIDTLHSIRQEMAPNIPLCFIMGSDAFNQFLHWKQWRDILKLCHLLVVGRPGHPLSQVCNNLAASDRDCFLRKELLDSPAGKIVFCEIPEINISSTAIRGKLRTNPEEAKAQLPTAVWHYIKQHKLYCH